MATDTSTQTVTDYLMSDHRRLDRLMETCRDLVDAGDMKWAATTYSEFRHGLLRHIKIEEGLLFPEFEAATGLARDGGPTGVMRLEHAEIIRLLDLVKELFDGTAPAAAAFDSLRSTLVALLHEHNGKEERILYPMTDQMVAPALLRDLVTRMKAFE